MSAIRDRDPDWVDKILDWHWTWFVARTALVGAYLVGGITKVFDFRSAIAEQEQLGLHPGAFWAASTIAVEIIAPLLIIWGRFVWLAAGALGVFTGLAAILAHRFWTMEGTARLMAMNTFLEHLGLIAGFVMTALIAAHARREGRP